MHALSTRGRLRFSFLPAVCLHVGLYVPCGAVLDRCGPIGSDVVISRTGAVVPRWLASTLGTGSLNNMLSMDHNCSIVYVGYRVCVRGYG